MTCINVDRQDIQTDMLTVIHDRHIDRSADRRIDAYAYYVIHYVAHALFVCEPFFFYLACD